MSSSSSKTIYFLNKNQTDRHELISELHLKNMRVETFYNVFDLISQLCDSACDLFLIDSSKQVEEEIFFYNSLKELVQFKDVVNCAHFDNQRQIFNEIIHRIEDKKEAEFKSVNQRLQILETETDYALVETLIKIFSEKKKYYKESFTLNLAANNFTKMQYDAHNLKASCGNLGALNMAQLCETIELEASEENLMKIKVYLTEIFFQYDHLEKYLIQISSKKNNLFQYS